MYTLLNYYFFKISFKYITVQKVFDIMRESKL